MMRSVPVVLVSALLLVPQGPAAAQADSSVAQLASAGATAPQAFPTRTQLQTRRDSLASLVGRSHDQSVIDQARMEMLRVDRRLQQGDFEPGDMVQLTVQGDSSLTGNFPVGPGPALELPTVDNVNLRGVLFAEADSVITADLSAYLRHPDIRVRVLRRVVVTGGVGRPGFYDFPPSTTLSQVIMTAGGPTSQAKLLDMQFKRDGKDLLSDMPPDERPNLTLADLGARRGDQLYVPQKGAQSFPLAALGVAGTLAGLAWALVRIGVL